jgi:hypothetical protein
VTTEFETWDSAAAHFVGTIYDQVRSKPKVSIPDLRKELDTFISSLWSSPGGNSAATARWSNLGANAFELSEKTSQPLTVAEVTETLWRKQHDYGPENVARFGRQGLMVRMHDKVARLENLIENDRMPAVAGEAERDTLMDIVGYSAIGMMWESHTFLLPLEWRPRKAS